MLTNTLLPGVFVVSSFRQMTAWRALVMIFLCAGLIFQGSVAASAMPQTQPMLASDCAKMKHHSVDAGTAHHHGDDADAPCDSMSLDCLLAMNAVSPVWVDQRSPMHIAAPILDGPVYLSNITAPLISRISTPESPPPRT